MRCVFSLDGFSEIVAPRALLINSHSCTTYKIETPNFSTVHCVTADTFRGSAGHAHNLITADFLRFPSRQLLRFPNTWSFHKRPRQTRRRNSRILMNNRRTHGSQKILFSSVRIIAPSFSLCPLPSCSELCREIESEPSLRSGVIKRSALRL